MYLEHIGKKLKLKIKKNMKLFKKILDFFNKKRNKKKQAELYKKKLEELRKRDPFVYKNH
jgi:hypothetical protein